MQELTANNLLIMIGNLKGNIPLRLLNLDNGNVMNEDARNFGRLGTVFTVIIINLYLHLLTIYII